MSQHGGKRPNSGPKKSMSPYGEKTIVMRIPQSLKGDVSSFLAAFKSQALGNIINTFSLMQPASLNPSIVERPIYSGTVSAGQSGFPSPAQDYEQNRVDLNKSYIDNPPATFFFQVAGDSMKDVGIFDGSTLIVDRSIKPKSSSIVVAVLDGELMVKRFYKRGGVVKLLSENPVYAPIDLTEGQELVIWGVVTFIITGAS